MRDDDEQGDEGSENANPFAKVLSSVAGSGEARRPPIKPDLDAYTRNPVRGGSETAEGPSTDQPLSKGSDGAYVNKEVVGARSNRKNSEASTQEKNTFANPGVLDKALSSARAVTSPRGTVRRKGNIGAMADVSVLMQDELSKLKILYPGMSQKGVLDGFRRTAIKLKEKARRDNFSTLVVPVSPSGGGSFCAVNLAASLALGSNATALYIDCNFSKPFSAEILGQNTPIGLIDYLEDSEVGLEEIIYATGISRLRLIPPGRGGEISVEYLASPRMRGLLEELSSRFEDRSIVLDAPAVSESSAARILSGLVDYSVLVVPPDRADREDIINNVEALGREKLAGVIFNQLD